VLFTFSLKCMVLFAISALCTYEIEIAVKSAPSPLVLTHMRGS
jgi:hypothetical protein